MAFRLVLLSLVLTWGMIIACNAMDNKLHTKEDLKLETPIATITYKSIKKACFSMEEMITGKYKHIYNSFFKQQEIPLSNLTSFCNRAIDHLEKEAAEDDALMDCLIGLEKSCEQKQIETLEKNIESGIPFGKRGSMIIPRNEAPIKGMSYYLSRDKMFKNTLDLKTILSLPENAPTGKGITIGLYERGIDINHEDVSECVKRSHQFECPLQSLNKVHGTSVGSVLASIAPGSAIHLITRDNVKELEDPDEIIKKMFFKSYEECDRDIFECLSSEQIQNVINEMMKLANDVFKDSKIINASCSFDENNIPDAQFRDTGTGMPFVLSLLANDAKKLIVKSAGNEKNPILNDLKDFANNNTSHRMILVGSLAYTEEGETFADDHSNYATSNDDNFICAPGKNILIGIAESDHEHTTKKGTSYATPIVSAFLADLMEKYPQWQEEPEKYISILLDSARRETLDGKDKQERKQNYQTRIGTKCGHGILDIPAALKLAEERAG